MTDIVAALFRAKRLIAAVFLCIFAALLTLIAIMPSKYEASMSFLVRNERADPLISADPHEVPSVQAEIPEEQINSEVELLGSKELLSQVVRACKLDQDYKGFFSRGEDQAVERATRRLAKDLAVTPVRKASVIKVSYKSSNADRSAAVLRALADAYLDAHLQLHRAGGAYGFFRDQAKIYRGQTEQAEAQLTSFARKNNVTLLPEQKDLTLRRLVELEQARDSAVASLAETESRISSIQAQVKGLSPRMVTEQRSTANQYSVERLNTMLADLKNHRTELAAKFRPGDRFLVETDRQIADTERELEDAKRLRSLDQSTNVNPLHETLLSDLAALKETRAGLISRIAKQNAEIGSVQSLLHRLDAATDQNRDMERNLKEAEDKYLLYSTKEEETRVADSLDRQKISNVVMAERPLVPALPASSRLNFVTAFLFAFLISVALGYLSEANKGVIHTPRECEAETGVPVLATVPWEAA
ncbi:MAG TPA: Wzz/FepE/Etk N-terminal domain-containing protein [Acidobacteriaceae bacterium]|nr:Wzz/FepE/Etk N-terminal domain-containing protein [Acidobacteriaceae bacterium]